MQQNSVVILFLLSFLCAVAVNASHLKDWQKVEAAQLHESVTFFVALKQRNVDQLEVYNNI